MSEYAERDPMLLDKMGNYYCRHVMAMTAEELHSKAAIAAELGYRDWRIDSLEKHIERLGNILKHMDERHERDHEAIMSLGSQIAILKAKTKE